VRSSSSTVRLASRQGKLASALSKAPRWRLELLPILLCIAPVQAANLFVDDVMIAAVAVNGAADSTNAGVTCFQMSMASSSAYFGAPRRFVWNPGLRITNRSRALWACGQAAFEPVHMSTGLCRRVML
jgi:hypothetical protein